jgi:hypothetical protein
VFVKGKDKSSGKRTQERSNLEIICAPLGQTYTFPPVLDTYIVCVGIIKFRDTLHSIVILKPGVLI